MDDERQAWERDGFAVVEGAAPAEVLAAYAEQLAAARDGLLVRAPGEERLELAAQLPADAQAGAIDPYAISEAARALLLAPAIRALVPGDAAPLLFDAAEAAAGAPDEGPYRDATFTALPDAPDLLVTVAVALGPEPATVTVHPGSQEIATAPFSGRYRHFNAERDGDAALQRHREELRAALGDGQDVTLAPGDALVWAAGLVHEPVRGAALVGHLAPSTVRPAWFRYRPERARCAPFEDGAAWVASQHYDLVDAIELDLDEPIPADEAEIERVADALREHDAELATEPQPGTAPTPSADEQPRRGGLVDSVRGLMGRRGRRRG
jgi:hypothetical protein